MNICRSRVAVATVTLVCNIDERALGTCWLF